MIQQAIALLNQVGLELTAEEMRGYRSTQDETTDFLVKRSGNMPVVLEQQNRFILAKRLLRI